MAPQLYVYKQEFDMLVQSVNDLKKNYTAVDHIAKRFDDLWHEQQFQAVQMTRIEDNMRSMEARLDKIEDNMRSMEARLDRIEDNMRSMQDDIKSIKVRLDQAETRLDRIGKLLVLICQKLNIDTNV